MTTITREELIQRISDPDTKLSSLHKYLQLEYDSKHGIRVDADNSHLEIAEDVDNPLTEANVAFDWVVKAIRARRRAIFERRLIKNPDDEIVLLDGDSWAQHPFVDEIFDFLSEDYNVYCSSLAGRTMQELHDENLYIEALGEIKDSGHFENIRAVVLSGGGNDLFGLRVNEIIKDFDESRPQDPEAHINLPLYNKLVDHILDLYSEVIRKISIFRGESTFRIIMHTYSYLSPWDVDSSALPKDKWLGDPMRRKGISDLGLQQAIIKNMVDRFHDKLESLVGDKIILLDNRNLIPLQKNMWSDEIHPSSKGFKLVCKPITEAIRTA